MARGHGRRKIEKATNAKQAFRGLLREFKPFRWHLLIIAFLLIIASLINIFIPIPFVERIQPIFHTPLPCGIKFVTRLIFSPFLT